MMSREYVLDIVDGEVVLAVGTIGTAVVAGIIFACATRAAQKTRQGQSAQKYSQDSEILTSMHGKILQTVIPPCRRLSCLPAKTP
jgi:hypothetical protein